MATPVDALAELNRRRANMTAEQTAALDELNRRNNFTPEPTDPTVNMIPGGLPGMPDPKSAINSDPRLKELKPGSSYPKAFGAGMGMPIDFTSLFGHPDSPDNTGNKLVSDFTTGSAELGGKKVVGEQYPPDQTKLDRQVGGGLKMATGTLKVAAPFFAGGALRYPLQTLFGMVVGEGANAATKYTIGEYDKYLHDGKQLYPASAEGAGLLAGILSGYKAGKAFQDKLAAKANASVSNDATNEFEKLLSVGKNKTDFRAALEEALPVIKEYEGTFQRSSPTIWQRMENPLQMGVKRPTIPQGQSLPPKGSMDFPGSVVERSVGAAEAAQSDVMNALEQTIAPLRQYVRVDMGPVLQAGDQALQGEGFLPHQRSTYINQIMDAIRQNPWADIDTVLGQIKQWNADLKPWYGKTEAGQNAANTLNSGDVAAINAMVKAARQQTYNAIDPSRGGEAPRALMKLWGNLQEVKNAFQDRLVQARASDPVGNPVLENLSTQANRGRAVMGLMQGKINPQAIYRSQAPEHLDRDLLNAWLNFGGKPKSITLPDAPSATGATLHTTAQPGGPNPNAKRLPGDYWDDSVKAFRNKNGAIIMDGQVPQDQTGPIQANVPNASPLSPQDRALFRGLPAANNPREYPNVPQGGVVPTQRPPAGQAPTPIQGRPTGVTQPSLPRNTIRVGNPMQPVPPRSYSDPFAAVSREQRTSLLKQLRNRGDVAELMVDGNKMMWKVLEDGKTIKRLR